MFHRTQLWQHLGTGTLLAALALYGCSTQNPKTRVLGEPAARVYGNVITQSEVDDWIRDEMFREQFAQKNATQRYEIRIAALERMIEARVVRTESARSELSREEFLQRELDALGPVTDADVAEFFEQSKSELGAATFEENAPRIRSYLEAERKGEAIAAILKRAEIEIMLERPRVEVSAEGPSRGAVDARVTIVEFSDFQCPFCARSVPQLNEVLRRYPDDVRIVYRHLPLESIHDRARPAAEAATCADAQQKFWPFHDLLFANNKKLTEADLKGYAEKVGLDLPQYQECIQGEAARSTVEADIQVARKHGITGTPAFLVNGILLTGARPAAEFIEIIDEELARNTGS